MVQIFFCRKLMSSRKKAQIKPFGWSLCAVGMGKLPICVYSQWGCYICYVESTLQSKRMLLGHRKCCPRAQTLPNSTELLSPSKPSLLWGLSVCWLCLYPVTVQDPVLMLIIQMQTGGLCVPVSHAVSKSGSRIPCQSRKVTSEGETLKLPSYRQNDGSWLFQSFPKLCMLLASTLWHPRQQSDCSTSQMPFRP